MSLRTSVIVNSSRTNTGLIRAQPTKQACTVTPFLRKHLASTPSQRSIFSPSPAMLSRRFSKQKTATTSASLTIKEGATGVEFPLVQKLWLGDEYRTLGAGARIKKVAFVGVKVYAIALYVEAEKAAHELGVRDRGGFFDTDDDYASAIVDGGFIKALQIELVRDIEGAQFVEALEENLKPRMSLAGELKTLDEFSSFFQGKKLAKGTTITLMYRTDATLDVVLRPSPTGTDYSAIVADLSIASASLCRSLFELYLGEKCVIPDAKKEWVKGAKDLLDSEKVRRSTRKSGGG